MLWELQQPTEAAESLLVENNNNNNNKSMNLSSELEVARLKRVTMDPTVT